METEKRLEDFIIDFAIPIRNSSEKEYNKTYDIEIKDKYQNYFNKIRGGGRVAVCVTNDLIHVISSAFFYDIATVTSESKHKIYFCFPPLLCHKGMHCFTVKYC